MIVRCPHCGYENDPQYRFCGRCGGGLPETEPERGLPSPVPQGTRSAAGSAAPVTESTKRSVAYLLEDEPRPTHWRMYLALAILIVSAGLLVWRWRHGGYPWALESVQSASSTTQAVPTDASPATSEAAPVAQPSEKPAAAENIQAAEQQAPPQTATSAEKSSPAATGAPFSEEQQSGRQASSESTSGLPAAAAEPDVTKAAAPVQPAPVKREPQTTEPTLSYTDTLVADGEKYLYGNGVPEDCSHAQKNLLAAARRSSGKAESILGTMYTTGHCVPRDLPTAYRWFAKALRRDPSNTRLQSDLEVVWRQMTPGERQIALRDQ